MRILLFIIIFFCFYSQTFAANDGVIINELLINPTGTDLNNEWIEIYNDSDSVINLRGYTFQVAGKNFIDSFTVNDDFEISPAEYSLICENNVLDCNFYVNKIGMQNGGDATDAVRIKDSNGLTIDTVLYDTPNINNLIGDNGEIAHDDECAENPSEGDSLGRITTFDTDISANDFINTDKPTPGYENSSGIYKNKVFISEVSFIDDFIEIYKYGDIDLTNWYVKTNKTSLTKYYLTGEQTFSLFSIDINLNPDSCVYLYSPDNVLRDSLCYKNDYISSFCILDLPPTATSSFSRCNPTKGLGNLRFSPILNSLDYIKRNATSTQIYYAKFCRTVEIGDKTVINDNSEGLLISDLIGDVDCYKAGIKYVDNGFHVVDYLEPIEYFIKPNPIDSVIADNQFISATGTVITFKNENYLFIKEFSTILKLSSGTSTKPQNGDMISVNGIVQFYSKNSSSNPKYLLHVTSLSTFSTSSDSNILSNSSGLSLLQFLFIFFLFSQSSDKLRHLTFTK